jgi:hypothetical protein
LAIASVKFPAVIATTHPLAFNPTVMQGNSSVRADIPEGEHFSVGASTDYNRFTEHFFVD